jgi:Bacterial TniB protein
LNCFYTTKIMSEHLTENAKAILELSNEERIEHILRDKWIGYNKAKEVLDKLDFLLKYPRKIRMPSLLIIGDTNNGKTALIRRFEQLHQPFDDPKSEELVLPVFSIQAPSVPDESRFYKDIGKIEN